MGWTYCRYARYCLENTDAGFSLWVVVAVVVMRRGEEKKLHDRVGTSESWWRRGRGRVRGRRGRSEPSDTPKVKERNGIERQGTDKQLMSMQA